MATEQRALAGRRRALSLLVRPTWTTGGDALDALDGATESPPSRPSPLLALDDANADPARRRSEGFAVVRVNLDALRARLAHTRAARRSGADSPSPLRTPDDASLSATDDDLGGLGASALSLGTGEDSSSSDSASHHAEEGGGSTTSLAGAGAPPAKRHIFHLRTLALAVRGFLALLRKVYREVQILHEPVPTPEGKLLVRAATLEGLVASLTPVASADQEYLQEMLLTLRFFCPAKDFVDRLVARFRVQDARSDVVQLRVINVLKRWLKDFAVDLDGDGAALERIRRFLSDDVAECDESVSRWVEPLQRLVADAATSAGSIGGGSAMLRRSLSLAQHTPTHSQRVAVRPFTDFTGINPVDVFRQLTLMEVSLFKAVTTRDLYYKTIERKHQNCPTLLKLIDHFNKVSFWVAKEVCFTGNLKQRVVVLKRFIYVAYMCLEWRNFNTCLEVVGGLTMTCVQRLKRTWKSLPAKYITMWKELQIVTSPRQNYIAYRTYVKTLEPPVLPYVGVYLSDLTFIQEKYLTRLAGGLINVAKLRMIAGVINDLQRYQATANFPFIENGLIRHYLELDTQVVSEEALYEASRAAEPSHSETPDLKSSSGSSFITPSTIGRSWRGTITPTSVLKGASNGSGGGSGSGTKAGAGSSLSSSPKGK